MSKEIDRWIKFMKEHPTEWKKIHSEFINAQFKKAYLFLNNLLKEPDGEKRIIQAYNIKNINAYKSLFKNNKEQIKNY